MPRQSDSGETEYRAAHRYAPVTARKAKPIVDLVRGKSVNAALEELRFVRRRAAPLLSKVIRSAVANASQDGNVDVNELYVKNCFANEGPLKQRRKRFRPGPQGRAMPILKRLSHLEVILSVRETKAAAGGRRRRARGENKKPADAGKAE